MPESRPAFQFVDLRQQHDVAQLGIWVFLATEVLFFGGLILAYCVYRSAYPVGFAEAARHTKIVIGTANTAILLSSSFLVAWAVSVTRLREARFAALLLWGAAVLGLVFIGLKGIEYSQEYHEHLLPGFGFDFPGARAHQVHLFFAFYIVATGLHALHVAVGIIVLAAIGWRAHQRAYSNVYNSPVVVAGLYWHFVDLVWIFLFALIYLPGRSG
jgi:cytochrome c oxidase subunit III